MKNVKFEKWALMWLEEKKKYVKESTYANYMIEVKNHLVPELGNYYMNEISKDIVQQMIIRFRESGRKDGKGGLSEKSVKDLVVILKMCLRDYGVEEHKIYRKNALRYPKENKVCKMQVLTEESYKKMLAAIKHEIDYEALGYALSLYTGMRIGEICALQWKDIDMEEKTISVTKTLQRIYLKDGENGKTQILISTPKSKTAVREIPISNALGELLLHSQRDGECYLISGTSHFIEPRLYRKHFEKFLERNGLMHIHFHALRHTFATRCIEKGADCKTVSCILGHSNVNLTLKLYVHPCLEQKRKCVELI